jgi:hypothetical protein
VRAYRESFRVARHDSARYADMSAEATEALACFCSDDVVEERLATLFTHLASQQNPATAEGVLF